MIPDKNGWYWVTDNIQNSKPYIVHFKIEDTGIVIKPHVPDLHKIENCYWAGPIPEPKNKKY